jgi:hypothetical protein
VIAKTVIVKNHYLHTFPAATMLCFGAFMDDRLLGAITFGCGPANAYRMVEGVTQEDCLTLSRLWLSDELPSNSESRFIGICLKYLKKYTQVKFVVSYADPEQGHVGTIYQATGWIYTGLSVATPRVDIGDGVLRHSRSISHSLGSHATGFMRDCGLKTKIIPQSRKHRYIYLLNQECQKMLKPAILPYPKLSGRSGE